MMPILKIDEAPKPVADAVEAIEAVLENDLDPEDSNLAEEYAAVTYWWPDDRMLCIKAQYRVSDPRSSDYRDAPLIRVFETIEGGADLETEDVDEAAEFIESLL